MFIYPFSEKGLLQTRQILSFQKESKHNFDRISPESASISP